MSVVLGPLPDAGGLAQGAAWGPRRPAPLDLRYVDEARTHEARARVVREGEEWAFVVVETAFGATDPADAWATRVPIQDAWEARFHQAELEGRLGHLGRYWRHDAARPGWLLLGRHPGVPRVDLRALPGPEPGSAFHAFRHGGAEADQLLVALPRRVGAGVRFLLGRLEYDFPRADAGNLLLLHERLPPGPARSLLAREHADLARRGYGKLVQPGDFAMAYGGDWERTAREVFGVALERLREGRTGVGAPVPEAAAPDAVITDYQRILLDPRLAAVHRRFLKPGEEEALLAQSEAEVRRAVAAKRRGTDHASQHLLSMLEASLLARRGLRDGSAVDAEVARQLRRLAYYL